ncbi:MAG TPA: T9SS type A sorting domain-containing protein, partial [Phnomibacter sp.]|nr:T9SS type A sorting domain-containing protein [Phnomibacter sp.]
VEVNNSNANSEASDLIVAEMIPGAPPSRSLPSSVTDVSGVRYYKITRTGNSGIDFRVRLPYGIDDGVTNPADLTIVKDDGTPTWQDIGGTPSGPLPGTILSAATFNQFSDFALAAKTGSLPVSWLSFTATPQAGHVILQWRTATEVNCQTYFIERSANGQQFTTIAQVACLNQQNGASYQYTDATLSAGTWYYRLRQVDADGRFAYSATRQVHLMATPAVALYPNPARHFVLVSGLTQGQQITVYNAAGASVASLVASGPTLRYSAAALAAGWYQVVITSQDGTRQTLPLQISK